ncbi:hypothetical protein CAEBREN_16299 [Caenorhabditis brenneri]|uniref:Uncharacterized protein n=1 Tax=Caenorhabditis brenneri TaxID=135651 RepID=G0N583_CAEBE|nr:hypothetical protein CAEBREN_16299 [Caenorhabditis brenneri]
MDDPPPDTPEISKKKIPISKNAISEDTEKPSETDDITNENETDPDELSIVENGTKAENIEEEIRKLTLTANGTIDDMQRTIPIRVCSLEHDHYFNDHDDCPVSTYRDLKEDDPPGAQYFFVSNRDAKLMFNKLRDARTPEKKTEVLEKYYKRFQFYSRSDSLILLRGFLHRTEESNDPALFSFLPLEVIETIKIALNREKKLTSQNKALIEKYEQLMKSSGINIVPMISLVAVEAIADKFNVNKNLIRIIRDFSYNTHSQILDMSGRRLSYPKDLQIWLFERFFSRLKSVEGRVNIDDLRMNALNLMEIHMETNYTFFYTLGRHNSNMTILCDKNNTKYTAEYDFYEYKFTDIIPMETYFDICETNNITIYKNLELLKDSETGIQVDFARTLRDIASIEKYIPKCSKLRKTLFKNLKSMHPDTPAEYWPVLKEEFLDKWEKLNPLPPTVSNISDKIETITNFTSYGYENFSKVTVMKILSHQWKIAVNHYSTLLDAWKQSIRNPRKFILNKIDVARPKTIFFVTDPAELFGPQIECEGERVAGNIEKLPDTDDGTNDTNKNMPSTSEKRVVKRGGRRPRRDLPQEVQLKYSKFLR